MSIEIFLDHHRNAFFPGQTISGRIECTFNKKTNLNAIKSRFLGRSNTEWRITRIVSKMTKTIRYCAEETYVDIYYNLVQGGENFSLAAGKHVYPFSYILPPQLPSSFEGHVGHIRYSFEAVVDCSWKFDYKAKVLLNIISPLDLNLIPALRDPVAGSDDKTMCSCWCNDSGALTFILSLPITGYVPGQQINIKSYVQNLTNVGAVSVKFKVVAKYEYIANYPSTHTKCHYEKIAICVEGGVAAHSEKSWIATLRIPTNHIYPNLRPCSIIKVHYNLKAKVVVPYPYSDLKLEFPITIGSVALSGVNTTILGPPLPDSEPPPPYQKDPDGVPPPFRRRWK